MLTERKRNGLERNVKQDLMTAAEMISCNILIDILLVMFEYVKFFWKDYKLSNMFKLGSALIELFIVKDDVKVSFRKLLLTPQIGKEIASVTE